MKQVSLPGIYALSTYIGQLVRVDMMEYDHCSFPNMVDDLKERGVVTFSCISDKLSEIIESLVIDTLEKAHLQYSAVDGVLIVTESYLELVDQPVENGEVPFRVGRNMIFELMSGIGLDNARVFSTTYGGSGNFLNAMFLADSLVRSRKVKNLLVVCFDRVQKDVSRFMEDAVAVVGDGISTFMYGYRRVFPGLVHRVLHINIVSFISVDRYTSMADKMLDMYKSTKESAAECYDSTGFQPRDFDWLVLNNYNYPTNRIFSSLLGFPLTKTWMHNAARTGHIASCDSLINLTDIVKSGNIVNKSKTFIFVNGPVFCGSIAIESRV